MARSMAMEADIIPLDEVMAGLNEREINEILDLLLGLNREGTTFLVLEHNLKVVRAFSPQVVVLDRARPLSEGTAEHILADPAAIAAYLGMTDA